MSNLKLRFMFHFIFLTLNFKLLKDHGLIAIDAETYRLNPNQYELRKGDETKAPFCPYGNHYEWIGFDKFNNEYLRFTKTVFK